MIGADLPISASTAGLLPYKQSSECNKDAAVTYEVPVTCQPDELVPYGTFVRWKLAVTPVLTPAPTNIHEQSRTLRWHK